MKLLRQRVIVILFALFIGCNSGFAKMPIGSNFWYLDNAQPYEGGNPWTGEKPFKAKINWLGAYQYNASTGLSDYNPWSQTFLDEIEWYTCLRFMDWNNCNRSGEWSWTTRTLPTDDQYTVGRTDGSRAGMAYEWQIDLCNRIGADIWINVPLKADNGYIWQLATLLRDKLRPDLKVYVELHNEMWLAKPMYGTPGYTGWDGTTRYGRDKANALGLGGVNDFDKSQRYYTYQSTFLWKMFYWNFGHQAYIDRVRPIIAGQCANADVGRKIKSYLADSTINPYWMWPYAYAVAPYFQQRGSGGDWQQIDAGISFIKDRVVENYYEWYWAGIKLVAYEGGQHLQGSGMAAINRSPEMNSRYDSYLRDLGPYFELFNHYAHCGKFSDTQNWGAKEYTGQSIKEAQKYRALYDYAH